MKRAILTILSFSVFLISKAQVAEFLSLQSTTLPKNYKGDLVRVKIWIGQKIHISFNLNQKRVQFFSKGMLDRDTFILEKEISILNKSASPNIGNDEMLIKYSGIDNSGKKCVVKLKLVKDEYQIQDGELRVEYMNTEEVYKIRNFRLDPIFNKSQVQKTF